MGGVLSMLAVLVVVSSAFSPTALAPRSAVSLRVRSVSAPVAMAGWNDQYQDDDPGRKKQELKTDKNDFDAEMARTAAWTAPRRPSSDFRWPSWPTSSTWWWQAERYLLPSSAVLTQGIRMRPTAAPPATA